MVFQLRGRQRRLILTNTMVWCPCYNPIFNYQLLLHQPPLRTAPCWLQMASVAQLGGCGGRAAAWAATEVHLGCFQAHSTCWCCIILFSGTMSKWMLFIISTPPAVQKFKVKAQKCRRSDCVFAWIRVDLQSCFLNMLCCGTADLVQFRRAVGWLRNTDT